jgi:lipopolysaccharide export system ATP-binding protein
MYAIKLTLFNPQHKTLIFAIMHSKIITSGLFKKYGARQVVNDVSIEVNQGEIVGLLGPNGAGKTTTFYMVVGLVQPDDGAVYLNDMDITKLPMYKRAKLGLGYLPQEASIFRKLTVEENILGVLQMTELSKKEQHDKLEMLLEEFRINHIRKSKGDVLSGGERRRCEIARALAVDPKFILLDEPFAGIDPIAVEDIQTLVAQLKYKNIGILITDHNVQETLSITDRSYLLVEGKLLKSGTAEELASDEVVRRVYLGMNFELKRKNY